MKRINLFFLSLLATLLVTTNVWGLTTEPEAGKYYTIKVYDNSGNEYGNVYVDGGNNLKATAKTTSGAVDVFYVEADNDGNKYLKHVGSGKYLAANKGTNSFSSTKAKVIFGNGTTDDFNILCSDNGSYRYLHVINSNGGSNDYYSSNSQTAAQLYNDKKNTSASWYCRVKFTECFEGIYKIKNVYNGRGELVYNSGYNNPVLNNITLSGYSGKSKAATGNGTYWYVKSYNGKVYIYNVENGKFLKNNNDAIEYSETVSEQTAFTYDCQTNSNTTYIRIISPTSTSKFISTSCGYDAGPNQVRFRGHEAVSDYLSLVADPDENMTKYATQVAAANSLIKSEVIYTVSAKDPAGNAVANGGVVYNGNHTNATTFTAHKDVEPSSTIFPAIDLTDHHYNANPTWGYDSNTKTITYTYSGYGVRYNENENSTHSDRYIPKISCTVNGVQTDVSLASTVQSQMYYDKTSTVIEVEAGREITPNFHWGATWMHSYVYLDKDNDGTFEVEDINAEELVACKYYNKGQKKDKNGVGSGQSDNCNISMGPDYAFAAPTTPGTYRLRYKVDWDNIEPAGGSSIQGNGGVIVDLTLKVVARTEKTYTVRVVGCATGSVKWNNTDYTNNQTFNTDAIISSETVTINTVTGYNSFLRIVGTDIYAYYHVPNNAAPTDGKAYKIYNLQKQADNQGPLWYMNYTNGQRNTIVTDVANATSFLVKSTGKAVDSRNSYWFRAADGNYLVWYGDSEGYEVSTDPTNPSATKEKRGYALTRDAEQSSLTDWTEIQLTNHSEQNGTKIIGRRSDSKYSTFIFNKNQTFQKAELAEFYNADNSNVCYLVEDVNANIVNVQFKAYKNDGTTELSNIPAGVGATYNNVAVDAVMPYWLLASDHTFVPGNVSPTDVSGYHAAVGDYNTTTKTLIVSYTMEKTAAWIALNTSITAALEHQSSLPNPVPDGTDPGYYNKDAVDALLDAITTAQGVLETVTTDEAYTSAKQTLDAAVAAAKMIMPVVGKTYQFISAFPAFETHAEGDKQKKAIYSNGSGLRWKAVNNNDVSMYWLVTKVDGNNITFQNVYDEKYPTGFSTANQMVPVSDTENYCELSLTNPVAAGQFYIRSHGSNADLHAGDHGSGKGTDGRIMVYNIHDTNNNCSSWYIHEQAAPEIVNFTYYVTKNSTRIWEKECTKIVVGQPYPTYEDNEFVTVTVPTGNVTSSDEGQEFELSYVQHISTASNVASVTQWYALDMNGKNGDYPVYSSSDNTNNNLRIQNSNVKDYKNGAVENDRYVWAFIGDPFNGIKLYNKAKQKYANHAKDADELVTFTDEGSVFQIHNTTNGTGYFACKKAGYSLYLNMRSTDVKAYSSNDGGSSFRAWPLNTTSFTTATQTVKASKYGTIIIPGYFAIPTGIKVYTYSGVEGNTLTLTEVTDIIHPNVPYIVKNITENNIEVTYTNTTQVNSHEALVTSGLLTGTYNQLTSSTDTKVPAGSYILLTKNEKQGFYIVETGNEPTVPANRCYLTLSTSEPSAGTKAFFFDDEPTGISDIDVDTNDDKIYNLAGQRVNKLQKGINIVNGKKVLF